MTLRMALAVARRNGTRFAIAPDGGTVDITDPNRTYTAAEIASDKWRMSQPVPLGSLTADLELVERIREMAQAEGCTQKDLVNRLLWGVIS